MVFLAGAGATVPRARRQVRVLRWTFARRGDLVVCELGLSDDDSAYELRIEQGCDSSPVTSELFDDAASAFARQGTIERRLIVGGWSLERFSSDWVER